LRTILIAETCRIVRQVFSFPRGVFHSGLLSCRCPAGYNSRTKAKAPFGDINPFYIVIYWFYVVFLCLFAMFYFSLFTVGNMAASKTDRDTKGLSIQSRVCASEKRHKRRE